MSGCRPTLGFQLVIDREAGLRIDEPRWEAAELRMLLLVSELEAFGDTVKPERWVVSLNFSVPKPMLEADG